MIKTIEKLVAKIAELKTTKHKINVTNEKNDAVIQIKGFQDHDAARIFSTELIKLLRKEQWKIQNEKHTLGNYESKNPKEKTDMSTYELSHPQKGEIHVTFAGHPTPGYLARVTLKNTQITNE